MRVARRVAVCLVAAGVLGWWVVSWMEAGTEIEVLCSLFEPGTDRARVLETLATGEYLRYRAADRGAGETIEVDSFYDLRTTRCVVEFDDGLVRRAVVAKR